MFKLMVSQDCGCSYNLYDQDEDLEELKKRAIKYDEAGLRWAIDNENDEPVEFSATHKQIIAFLQRVNSVPRENARRR